MGKRTRAYAKIFTVAPHPNSPRRWRYIYSFAERARACVLRALQRRAFTSAECRESLFVCVCVCKGGSNTSVSCVYFLALFLAPFSLAEGLCARVFWSCVIGFSREKRVRRLSLTTGGMNFFVRRAYIHLQACVRRWYLRVRRYVTKAEPRATISYCTVHARLGRFIISFYARVMCTYAALKKYRSK